MGFPHPFCNALIAPPQTQSSPCLRQYDVDTSALRSGIFVLTRVFILTDIFILKPTTSYPLHFDAACRRTPETKMNPNIPGFYYGMSRALVLTFPVFTDSITQIPRKGSTSRSKPTMLLPLDHSTLWNPSRGSAQRKRSAYMTPKPRMLVNPPAEVPESNPFQSACISRDSPQSGISESPVSRCGQRDRIPHVLSQCDA